MKKLDRREELLKYVNDSALQPLVDKMIFLEERLEELEKLPMISVNPKNPMQQKATPASKLFKEFLQQYVNVVKVIAKKTNDDSNEEESPLRKWLRSRC